MTQLYNEPDVLDRVWGAPAGRRVGVLSIMWRSRQNRLPAIALWFYGASTCPCSHALRGNKDTGSVDNSDLIITPGLGMRSHAERGNEVSKDESRERGPHEWSPGMSLCQVFWIPACVGMTLTKRHAHQDPRRSIQAPARCRPGVPVRRTVAATDPPGVGEPVPAPGIRVSTRFGPCSGSGLAGRPGNWSTA